MQGVVPSQRQHVAESRSGPGISGLPGPLTVDAIKYLRCGHGPSLEEMLSSTRESATKPVIHKELLVPGMEVRVGFSVSRPQCARSRADRDHFVATIRSQPLAKPTSGPNLGYIWADSDQRNNHHAMLRSMWADRGPDVTRIGPESTQWQYQGPSERWNQLESADHSEITPNRCTTLVTCDQYLTRSVPNLAAFGLLFSSPRCSSSPMQERMHTG
jgi:hypothetical protein